MSNSLRLGMIGALALGTLLAMGDAPAQGKAAAIVRNSGFEAGDASTISDWRGDDWSKNTAVCALDKTQRHGGAQSVKITSGKGGNVFWLSQEITLKPHTEYILSGWMKGDKIASDKDGASIYVWRGRGYDKGCAQFGPLRGTFDWTNETVSGQKFISFNTGEDTVFTVKPVLYGAEGAVWFDDITIEEKGNSPLVASSFPLKAIIPTIDWQEGKTLHLLDNSPNPLTLWYLGDPGKCKSPELVLELPADIALAAAYSQYVGLAALAPSAERTVGGERRQYTFPLRTLERVSGLNWNRPGWRLGDYFCLVPKNCAGKDYIIHWRLRANGVDGEAKTFKAQVIPQLEPTSNPSRFKLFTYNVDWYPADKKVRDGYYELYKEIGIDGQGLYAAGEDVPEDIMRRAKADGWLFHKMIGWCGECSWRGYLDTKLGKDWEARLAKEEGGIWLVGADGKERKSIFCPGYAAQKGEAFLGGFKSTLKQYEEIKYFLCDIEPEDYDFAKGCFCPRCVGKFSKENQIQAAGLTPRKILAEHKDAWSSFCQVQVARLVGVMTDAFKEVMPGVEVGMVSDYVRPSNKGRKGAFDCSLSCNAVLFDKLGNMDGHWPMMYFAELPFFDSIEATVDSLGKPVYPLLAVNERFSETYTRYDAAKIRKCLLAAAVCGAKGAYFWSSPPDDGLCLKKIDQATHEIAQVEGYLFDGRRTDSAAVVKNLPQETGLLRHKVHVRGDDYLVSLFNYDETKDCLVNISFPVAKEGCYLLHDPVTRLVLRHGGRDFWTARELRDGFVHRVPKDEVAFLAVERYADQGKWPEADSVQPSPARDKVDLREGPLSLRWDDGHANGVECLVMESQREGIWLNPWHGGQLWGWRGKQDGQELVRVSPDNLGGGACMDLFWCPQEMVWSGEEGKVYRLVSWGIKDRQARVVFERKVEKEGLRGLLLTKTYLLREDTPGIQVKCKFRNQSGESLEFGFWSHSLFQLGGGPVAITVPTSKGAVEFQCTEGNYVYNVPDVEEDFLKGCRKGDIAAGWLALSTPAGPELRVTLEHDKLFQAYFYHGGKDDTYEWMYKRVRLNPGEEWETSFTLTYNANAARKS